MTIVRSASLWNCMLFLSFTDLLEARQVFIALRLITQVLCSYRINPIWQLIIVWVIIEFVRIESGTFGIGYFNTAVRAKLHQGSSYSCIRPPHVYKKCRSLDNCTALAKEYRQFAIPFMHPAIPFYRPPMNSTTMSSRIIPSVKMTPSGPAPMSYPLPSALKSKLIDLF